jgi:hypothetical protein
VAARGRGRDRGCAGGNANQNGGNNQFNHENEEVEVEVEHCVAGGVPAAGAVVVNVPVHAMTFPKCMSMRLDTFDGSGTPTDVADWLRKMEKAMAACRMSGEEMVIFIPHQLIGQADIWWVGVCDAWTRARGAVTLEVLCLGSMISIDGHDFVANLMVIPFPIFDVVLDMDWLHRYRVVISCFRKTLTLEAPSGQTIIFQANPPIQTLYVMACLFLSRRPVKTGFLWSLVDKPIKSLIIEEILVVREYPDVFPDMLPGMPPNCAVGFRIDLMPGTRPVSLALYRLSHPFQE